MAGKTKDWQLIQSDYESGMSFPLIHEKHGVLKMSVSRKAKERGWIRRVDIERAIDLGRARSIAKVSPNVTDMLPSNVTDVTAKRKATETAASRFEQVFTKWGDETDRVRALADAGVAMLLEPKDDKTIKEAFELLKNVKITTEIQANLRTADMQRYGIKPAQKVEHEITDKNNGASPLDDKIIKRLESLREVQPS
jgi:DNA primase large subunit